MIKSTVFYLTLFFISTEVIGQINPNIDSYEYYFGSISKAVDLKVHELNGKFHLVANNTSYYPHLVSVELDLTNMTCNKVTSFKEIAFTGNTTLAYFQPTRPDAGYSYSFKFTTTLGNPFLKPNDSITYLIPFQPGKDISVSSTKNLDPTVIFNCSIGDTVFASRKGIVCALPSDSENDTYRYALSKNFEVYQGDGTLAIYSPLSKVFKKKGDKVIPGEPVGIVLQNYFVFTVIHFLPNSEIKPVPIKYFTEKGNLSYFENNTKIQISHPESIIVKELTKKEKRKRK